MSGIYIPGMDMPQSCGYCCFEKHTDDGYECGINGCLTEYQKRPSDCPLVPVPPHGRLIDADALEKEHMKRAYENFRSYQFHVTATAWINEAPTILPADKEATE